MATISVTLDTNNRQTILAIDGVIVGAKDYYIESYTDMDGEKRVHFGYTIEETNEKGLMERRTFMLPPKDEDSIASVNENGLVEKKQSESEKLAEDIKKFIKKE